MSLYSTQRGNINANAQIITIDDSASSLIALDIRGTFVGTLQFESTIDGINWFAATGVALPFTGNNPVVVASTTAAGAWLIDTTGVSTVRIRASAWTSGTALIFMRAVDNNSLISFVGGAQTSVNTPSATVGGYTTTFHLISAATTNATVVKGTPGTINNVTVSNGSAAVKFLKIYNKATAPTVGTDTPIATILVPVAGTVTIPFNGLRLSAGIGIATTGLITVADTTAVALNDLAIHIDYI